MPNEVRLAVLLGGAAGTFLRWSVARIIDIDSFPLATLLVNLVGAYLLARLGDWAVTRTPVERTFLTVGLLGSFTTFSAVAVDLVALGDRPLLAGLYGFFTLSGGLLVVRLGSQGHARWEQEVGR